MKKYLLTMALCGLSVVTHAEVTVTQAWTKAVTARQSTVAVYATLANTTPRTQHIIGVTSPVAERAQFKTSVMDPHGRLILKTLPSLVLTPNETMAYNYVGTAKVFRYY